MKYFAYGSNMSLNRIRQRVPSARVLGTFSLADHELRFHKHGRDDSGKCDAFYTGNSSHVVRGVLYEIDASEKAVLDQAEGLGNGYDEKDVNLFDVAGNVAQAVSYYATNINSSLLPFTWYKDHVLIGAREAILPEEYITRIAGIESIVDPDREREMEQRAIQMASLS